MWYAATVARVLLGLAFTASAVLYFVTVARGEFAGQGLEGEAREFIMGMHVTRYMFAVKIIELIGGLLLISGYLVPVGLSLLGPVIVNVLFYHLFMDRNVPYSLPIPLVFVAFEVFLIYAYRKQFAPIFDPLAKPG